MSIRLLIAVTVLLAAGCGEETGDGDESRSGPALDGRTFIATSIMDSGAIRHLAPGTELRLTFDGGELGINAGCNHMSGRYDVDGERMKIGSMSTTEMGCEPRLMAQDVWVSGVFTEPLTVDLTGDTLRLTSETVEMMLTDREVASPDAELTGTTWVLDALITDDAVSSVPGGVVATLRIDDGKVRIDNGCNAVTGEVAIDGNTITFTNMITTDMSCGAASDEGKVEQAVNAVLADTATWVITEKSLTVQRGSNGLGFRVA